MHLALFQRLFRRQLHEERGVVAWLSTAHSRTGRRPAFVSCSMGCSHMKQQHCLVVAYGKLLRRFLSCLMHLDGHFLNKSDLPAKPVQWFQIRFLLWFNQQYLSTPFFLPAPEVGEVINAVEELRHCWEPLMRISSPVHMHQRRCCRGNWNDW